MSPDSDAFARIVDRATRRAQILAAAESAAVGAAIAAWSTTAGAVAAIGVALWRSRNLTRRASVRTLERGDPQARNLLVTADELSTGRLDARPHVRNRVVSEALALVRSMDINRLFPSARASITGVVALAAWAAAFLAGAAHREGSGARPAAAPNTASTVASPIAEGNLHVSVTIEPPPYTHRPSATLRDPSRLQALEHSTMRVAVETAGPRAAVSLSGDEHALTPAPGGAFEFRATLTRSGYLLVTAGDGGRRLMPITVTPDALPAVRIVRPGRDLVYAGGNPRIGFDAQASDDYGLRALTLRYTKVSGSGEQFAFTDGEIPLTIVEASEREWRGSAARTLNELGLAEGDMLVYRAVAADNRPGDADASSETYFIEISKLGVAAGDAFTLPEQETRYALSQQMLIVKTERLNQRRASMDAPAFSEASQGLAVEQRMIRSEFVFMLGGEVEDEEVEAEQSVEVQAGRLANRGQRDIRAATIAMSQAEKLLTGASTAAALKAERAAVEALQRAFARDRYILRALATRSQLDPGRRLTGSIDGAVGWQRRLAEAPANRRAALLQGLLGGLGAAGDARQLSVLSELAIRIDPQSAALSSIAADLQRLADAWPTADAQLRKRTIDGIASAVSAEARRAFADPPAVPRSGR